MDKETNYQSPEVIIIEVEVEKGFAESLGAGGENGGWVTYYFGGEF